MNTCNTTIDEFQREDGDLDVSEKYIQLMQDSLGDESIYIRAKDTFKVMFDNLDMTDKEKAQILSQHISAMTVQLSGAAMQTALAWEEKERDGAYALAQAKAQTQLIIAQTAKAEEEICLAQMQTKLACANILATVSGTYRDNGIPTGYKEDGCTPTGLSDDGLKYHQTEKVKGETYQVFADAYRKSGVVQLGVDVQDETYKGLSGDDYGYTHTQIEFSERQRFAFEDSKINHLVNGSATVLGQQAASDAGMDPTMYQLLVDGMNRLAQTHSTTSEL